MRRATTAPLAAFAACALAVPGPAGAQWTGYVDAAVSRLDQAGLRASAAQSFAATIDGLTQHTWLRASALGSAQPNGGWTGQALALGGFTFRLSDVVRWDAGA